MMRVYLGDIIDKQFVVVRGWEELRNTAATGIPVDLESTEEGGPSLRVRVRSYTKPNVRAVVMVTVIGGENNVYATVDPHTNILTIVA
jgi:hypothetical protein